MILKCKVLNKTVEVHACTHKMLTICFMQHIKDKDIMILFACPLNPSEKKKKPAEYIFNIIHFSVKYKFIWLAEKHSGE